MSTRQAPARKKPARKTVASRAPVRRAAAPRKLYGRGDYSTTRAAYKVNSAKADYQPSLGRMVLQDGGAWLGGDLGRTAGKHLSHLFGFGDYKVKSNIFLNGQLPQMVNMPSGGGTIIRFQEYLGDVITSSSANTFNAQSYTINPAASTFPWLSQIASNYEQYSFEGLVFEFRSTSADALNSTNTALGTVMMATQYDVADNAFASKAEMLNHEFSNSVKPSDSCLHMIECAPRQTTLTELYTNSGATPAGTDPRFYNLGRFQIATTGFQGTSVNVGELHCTYQCRLMKPKLVDAIGQDSGFGSYLVTGALTGVGMGTARAVVKDNIGITFTNNSFTIPDNAVPKTYIADFISTQAVTSTPYTFAAPTISGGVLAGTLKGTPYIIASSGTSFAWSFTFITTPGSAVTCTLGITFANAINGVFKLHEIPPYAPYA